MTARRDRLRVTVAAKKPCLVVESRSISTARKTRRTTIPRCVACRPEARQQSTTGPWRARRARLVEFTNLEEAAGKLARYGAEKSGAVRATYSKEPYKV